MNPEEAAHRCHATNPGILETLFVGNVVNAILYAMATLVIQIMSCVILYIVKCSNAFILVSLTFFILGFGFMSA